MTEKTFGDKLIENHESFSKNDLSFVKNDNDDVKSELKQIVKEDQNDYGALRSNLVSDQESSYIIDNTIIKGISPVRSENDCNFDYDLLKNREPVGLRCYQHKYFSGYMHYYLHLKYQQHLQRI